MGSGSLDLPIHNLVAQNEDGPDLARWAAEGHSTPVPGFSRGYSATQVSLVYEQTQDIIHEFSKTFGGTMLDVLQQCSPFRGREMVPLGGLPVDYPWNVLGLITDRSWGDMASHLTLPQIEMLRSTC
jgi:hypothetical protein